MRINGFLNIFFLFYLTAEKIRVGRDYQVVCPDLVPVPERKPDTLNDRALLVWSPTKDIPEIKRELNFISYFF